MAPYSQVSHLLPVGGLIVVTDEACHGCINYKVDDAVKLSCLAVQSCVKRLYNRGLIQQPWGTPVLNTRVDEVRLPIFTDY